MGQPPDHLILLYLMKEFYYAGSDNYKETR
jgi:hypothetical protein